MVGNLSKYLYKIELFSIKVIPMVIAFLYLLNTTLSYFDIDAYYLSYAVMFLFIGFLYISSFVFKFCTWHRLFIHYISLNLILNIIDYYYGLPLSDRDLFILYMMITCIFIFLLLILKINYESHNPKDLS